MQKPKDKKKNDKPSGKAASSGDGDDDVFDRAVNGMLRSTQVSQLQPRLAAATLATDFTVGEVAVCDVSDTASSEPGDVRKAVSDTWRKADAIKDLAVESAVKSAIAKVREEYDKEYAVKVAELKDQIRCEVEEARRRIWERATKEQERAIEAALTAQAAALRRAEQELEDERARAAKERTILMESAKDVLRTEVAEEHANEMNQAIQALWDSARIQQESAVAVAVAATQKQERKYAEEMTARERMTIRAEARRTIQESDESQASTISALKAENRKIREQVSELTAELDVARHAVREAEYKAAQEQHRAVREAVQATEEVYKSLASRQ